MNKPVLVFDIAETILDLQGLTPVLERIFDHTTILRTWFDEVILYSQALSITGNYADAGRVGVAVLEMLARTRGRTVSAAHLAMFKQTACSLQPYPDVKSGLARLQLNGFDMVTLSNNPRATCETQLTYAGIRPFFKHVFSIDDVVRRYKPAPESYLAVAKALDASPANLWLITCHAFDAMGAKSAGLHAAFIERPGKASFMVGEQPDLMGDDLDELSHLLINQFAS
ncbi:hypothetical protein ASG35_12835 [Burkholderia sp. Leaf177]|nr:hypothetical protein ASG35_12835 [Burkholderia sp. Leaf177]